MKCEHILTKGARSGQQCPIYTNIKKAGKYLCTGHRKLNQYLTDEDKDEDKIVEPANNVKEIVEETIDVVTHQLASLEAIEEEVDKIDEDNNNEESELDKMRNSLVKIATAEQVDKYINMKKVQDKLEKKQKKSKKGVLSDDFGEFRLQVEDCIAQLYDEILSIRNSVQQSTKNASKVVAPVKTQVVYEPDDVDDGEDDSGYTDHDDDYDYEIEIEPQFYELGDMIV